ncbi:MaoC/PaaZ C-terminal domain-containing protein [Intrasporangium sp.]|uniref:MaoC family dehydratase n=1 Tax=Intrasporangium sp. TaxID=1925024 RepID=UPI003221663E
MTPEPKQEPPVRELPGAVEFTKTITEFDVYSFAGITGDFYPVHINAVYAASHPVGERVAHGALTVGLMSTVAGRWMLQNGVDGLSLGYNRMRFTKPVRFGDTISLAQAMTARSEDGHRITCRVEARNQHDEVVAVAEHLIWDAEPPGQ